MLNQSNNRLGLAIASDNEYCDENKDDGGLEPDKDDVGCSRRPHRQRLTMANGWGSP
jgi:hypothetical protein